MREHISIHTPIHTVIVVRGIGVVPSFLQPTLAFIESHVTFFVFRHGSNDHAIAIHACFKTGVQHCSMINADTHFPRMQQRSGSKAELDTTRDTDTTSATGITTGT